MVAVGLAVALGGACATDDTPPTRTGAGPSVTTGAVGSTSAFSPSTVGGLPEGDDAAVERIVDGDTLVLAGGTRVRLIGIDTPETKDPRQPVECFGQEASAHLTDLVPTGTPVRLVYDIERQDRFDRTLAYLYRSADGLFVNAAMVRDGYAAAATFPPNVARAEEFVALQREARERGLGLWGACPTNG